ncbi:hypothetical protein B296_00054097 [Ensete ventricosum]|uniref:Uncharacterized protein n=1 Tax=Ensete ventricosum TaxID=4639 RepID=A0A426XUA8_ENSVE|nr:hypothetical protein B296_00054097 [Ensete ventricosum]
MRSTHLRWRNSIHCCRSTTCPPQRRPSPSSSAAAMSTAHCPQLANSGGGPQRHPGVTRRERERRLHSLHPSSYCSRFSHPITLPAPAVGFPHCPHRLPDCEAKETFCLWWSRAGRRKGGEGV